MKMNGAGVWLRGISGAVMAFLYLPILVLAVFSFNDSRLSAVWQGFSWHWYGVLWHDAALLAAAANSLLVAALSTSLVVLLGVPAAMGLERLRGRGVRVVETIFLLPLILPEVMMGVALLLFFVMVRWPLSLATVVIGHAAFNLPVVVVLVRARLQKLDPRLEEAARDLVENSRRRVQAKLQTASNLAKPVRLDALKHAIAMGVTDAGIFGDILCARMKKRGVAGLVTDGVVRDLAGVLGTGLPVWCRGGAAPPQRQGAPMAFDDQPDERLRKEMFTREAGGPLGEELAQAQAAVVRVAPGRGPAHGEGVGRAADDRRPRPEPLPPGAARARPGARGAGSWPHGRDQPPVLRAR